MKNLSRLLLLSFVLVPALRADVGSDIKEGWNELKSKVKYELVDKPREAREAQEARTKKWRELQENFLKVNRELEACGKGKCDKEKAGWDRIEPSTSISRFNADLQRWEMKMSSEEREAGDRYQFCLKLKCPDLYEKAEKEGKKINGSRAGYPADTGFAYTYEYPADSKERKNGFTREESIAIPGLGISYAKTGEIFYVFHIEHRLEPGYKR